MSDIKQNIETFKNKLPENVTLVAVSKTKPLEDIREAYDSGHRVFGENKAQELKDKQPELPDDIQWHFIGHMQTNKVKYIAPFVSLIHSVDRFKVLKEINKQAQKNDRVIPCLLQFHIAEEDTKFGFDWAEVKEMLDSEAYQNLTNIRIDGVMAMATFTQDTEQIRREFRQLKSFFDRLQSDYFSESAHFKEISMGMTNDYQIAIEEGSTMLRIGSALFGARNYT
ncbi:MAG: YggS family pyridoxal phosphate-dependent enzyme [Bacteroidales bacterium]|nr:YggS family pyridoxal phosphate-dependent enzyme [Bacteroidales bacterium]MCF8326954.1 YggS family pyridoxal phosphate-dependent enzyme [Bacteroidales bacterium]